MVLGGLSLTDKATWVTSGISAVTLFDIVFTSSHGSLGTSAVMASRDSTILLTIKYP